MPPQRDASAVAGVAAAVAALGGTASLSAVQDATATGTFLEESGGAINASAVIGTFTWTYRFPAPVPGAAGGNPLPDFRVSTQDTKGRRTDFAGGAASPALMGTGKPSRLHQQVKVSALPFALPGKILLRVLSDPRYAITSAPAESINGIAAAHVRVAMGNDGAAASITAEDWFFDPSTGLPLRVSYFVPSAYGNALVGRLQSVDYLGFGGSGGIAVASALLVRWGVPSGPAYQHQGGVVPSLPDRRFAIASVAINTDPPPSTFDLGGVQP